ncbi:MAG TPA: FtsQ-type POTRA domain-containing protein [Solirubrobacteraceae bacterium]|jgi:cell division protein FtsQ
MEHVLPRRLRLTPRRRKGPRSRSRGRGSGQPQGLAALLRTLRKPSRRIVLIALLLIAIFSGGFLWFRSSSFVAVERVQIGGVHGVQAGAVEAALVAQARQMSTMNVNVGALEAAVARFHLVRSISVKANFPHSLQISVTEQLPVAVLSAGGQRTAVASDGLVLGRSLAAGNLPMVPTSSQLSVGEVVGSHRLRSFLTVLGAAPSPLLRLVKQIYHGAQGLTLKMKDGLLVYFGDASRPHAKWASLAAVLANSESAGAIYVDVRMPERPAAGMPEGEETGASEGAEVSATDPSSAALAETLASAVDSAVSPSSASTIEEPEEEVGAEVTEEPSEETTESSADAEAEGEYESEATEP